MSPLKIAMLLHVYAIVTDYRDAQANRAHANSEAVSEAFDDFVLDGLVTRECSDDDWRAQKPDNRSSQYRITDKGRAMVEHLCAIQIPICKWVQP